MATGEISFQHERGDQPCVVGAGRGQARVRGGGAEVGGHGDGVEVEAAGAPSFTRILVHPEIGAVLSIGRDRYTVPKELKRFLWRVLHLGDGLLQWTSPTGRTFVSEPATVIRSASTKPPPASPAPGTGSEVPAPF